MDISGFPQTITVPVAFDKVRSIETGRLRRLVSMDPRGGASCGAVGNFTARLRWWCGGLLGPFGTAKARDVLACLRALFEELGLVGIGGVHVVAFLVAHLAFDRYL